MATNEGRTRGALALRTSAMIAGAGACVIALACKEGEPTCAQGTRIASPVYVHGHNVPLLTAPSSDAPRVVNQRASAAVHETVYRTVDPAYGLRGLCRLPKYVQVQIVSADGNTVDWGEVGWIEAEKVSTRPTEDQSEGLLFDVSADHSLTPQQRKRVHDEARRVLREDPRCEHIVDGDRSSRSRRGYYLVCSPSEGGNYNVWIDF
jgi:hypothetical protein